MLHLFAFGLSMAHHLDLLLHILNPLKISFELVIGKYLESLRQIVLEGNSMPLHQITFLHHLCLTRALEMILFYFLPSTWHTFRVVQFDFISILNIMPEYNLCFAIVFVSIAVMLNILYCNQNCIHPSELIYNVLLGVGKRRYFLSSTYRGKSIRDRLNRVVRWYLRYFLGFTLMTGLCPSVLAHHSAHSLALLEQSSGLW